MGWYKVYGILDMNTQWKFTNSAIYYRDIFCYRFFAIGNICLQNHLIKSNDKDFSSEGFGKSQLNKTLALPHKKQTFL
jgi:hypothetical protein